MEDFVRIGDRFPEMEVLTTQGTLRLPEHFRGRWFVLFSHPGDFTPVCTSEFISFERHINEFRRMNTELIGLSVDEVYAHLKWLEWIQQKFGIPITFPVIADPLGRVASRLGMLPRGGTATVRSVFIVDEAATVRLILNYPAEVGRNIPEIVRAVRALRLATSLHVSTPANWPQNEIIGAQIFLPPPRTGEEIRERYEQMKKGEIQCFDWWMCVAQAQDEKKAPPSKRGEAAANPS
ncbi:peroxiredoxin [Brockia lithotrophica]|uniref:Peroxiredoxin n=1 Tax=Brockia lithotrophica TaxID=933949 RepID=A0A660KUW8_9BACL|nr:peroxiredoxin [Brockia lithotrophica]RKQ83805.1 1-Cys peroxiredoxin [Brockia lithotrophica]